jgi:hypothetical protein
MKLSLHPDIRIRKLSIGREQAPLLVIDNFLADAEALVEDAAGTSFAELSRYYPGVRAKAPTDYEQLMAGALRDLLLECLEVDHGSVTFSMCHYSLVTTPPRKLLPPQRIPHVDSLAKKGLASIHYLFKGNLGGTSFYRHRRTGFEYIDEARNETYFRALREEHIGEDTLEPAYINGSTELFEELSRQEGVFNRLLVYRRNSLHSGCIAKTFVPDPNPRTGRLSINSFIDLKH